MGAEGPRPLAVGVLNATFSVHIQLTFRCVLSDIGVVLQRYNVASHLIKGHVIKGRPHQKKVLKYNSNFAMRKSGSSKGPPHGAARSTGTGPKKNAPKRRAQDAEAVAAAAAENDAAAAEASSSSSSSSDAEGDGGAARGGAAVARSNSARSTSDVQRKLQELAKEKELVEKEKELVQKENAMLRERLQKVHRWFTICSLSS